MKWKFIANFSKIFFENIIKILALLIYINIVQK